MVARSKALTKDAKIGMKRLLGNGENVDGEREKLVFLVVVAKNWSILYLFLNYSNLKKSLYLPSIY